MSGEHEFESGQAGVGVAEDQPAELTEDVPEGMARCPECKQIVSVRGLGIHRAKAHGVPGKAASKPKKKRGAGVRKGPGKAEGGVTAEAVAEAFELIRGELQRSDVLVRGCLDGLEMVTEDVMKLRGSYLKKSDRLAKLLAKGRELSGKKGGG